MSQNVVTPLWLLFLAGVFVLPTIAAIVIAVLAWRSRHRKPSAARPKPDVTPTRYVDSYTSVAIIARLAERFCPACRAPLERDAPEGLCPACLMAGGIGSQFAEEPADGFAATTPPGVRPDTADHDIAGLQATFPQLEIQELLGRGGMGSVYKVRQRNLDRVVALKVIPPASARDPEFAERFAREARALARLNHPNIVTVYDFGQAGEVYYLLMEYVDGVNLRHTLRAGRLQPEEALAVVPQICDALQYAHDQGVVHRDIKPENVLLDRSGRIKIADFGLAKLLGIAAEDFHLTRTQQVMGTPRYMAPEQIERPSSVDHRADIYSLGVVIYEMLTGELPVGRFPPPSQRSGVGSRVDDVVLRSLEKEPDLRYQRASQVKSELTAASAGVHSSEGTTPGADWSGPRFPTPSPVYVEPKPPAYETTSGSPPLALLLALAAGMVIGCVMITVGLALAVLALTWPPMATGTFGGWFGAAFGFICGGGGSLIGSYNSYRQLAGAEDLLRTPHTTWFDWLMRGYLLLGIVLFAASFIDFADGNPAIVTFPILLIIGSIMLAQGALFALIRSLMPERSADSRYGSRDNGDVSPSLWRAAGIPTVALAVVWLIVVVDVLYATPIIAHDDRGSQWLSYLFYQRWQVANWAIGVGLIPLCFGLLATCRALGRRTVAGRSRAVAYPFEHPGWTLGVALLGLSTTVLPWMTLEHVADHVASFDATRDWGRDFSAIDMSAIAGLPGRYRYATRDVVFERLGLAVLCSLVLGIIALVPNMPHRIRSLVAIGSGLALLGIAVTLLHEMGDQPSKFILDQRTVTGINNFVQKLGGSPVAASEWAGPLSEVITVRPAIGLFALLTAAICSIVLGVSGLSWQSGTIEPTTLSHVAEVPPAKSPAPVFQMNPAAKERQRVLDQVRGPATGLFVAGVFGLSPILLSLVAMPATIVTVRAPAVIGNQLPTAAVACTSGSGCGGATISRLLRELRAFRFAQDMSDADRTAYEMATVRANWASMIISGTIVLIFSLPGSIFLMLGSLSMRKLESYKFAFGAAVLACVPCTPAWLIGFPMGIWAITVLLRPDVKAAFDQPRFD